jgi:ABC-type polysaccharide/polyol phosphate export permease
MIGTDYRLNKSFAESLSGLLQNFELIRFLTADELRRTYTGSLMGPYWILLKPALLVGLYGALFGIVFQARGGPRQTASEYLLVLLTGLLPWLFFSEAVSAAASSITANTSLVTKIVFPVEILPVSKALATMLSGLVGLALLVVLMTVLHQVGWTLVLLPLLLVAQVVFTIGLAWVLSAFNVAVRDTSQALPLVLMVWMFLSPVVYTSEMVPKALAVVFACNPMSYFLDGYRMILLANQPPTVLIWAVVTGMAVTVFLAGFWVLCRMRALIADFV